MKVHDILRQQKTISVEFFPPRTDEAYSAFSRTLEIVKKYNINYASVTSSLQYPMDVTFHITRQVQKNISAPGVCHLLCGKMTREDISFHLERCRVMNIQNVLVLRGDQRNREERIVQREGNHAFCHAGDLVAFVQRKFPDCSIGVAGFPEGHPETPNRFKEMDYLKWKVDQGAHYIVTQLFFDNRDFFDFCERAVLAGIFVPIIAGVMVVRAKKMLQKIAELAQGARIPAKLLSAVQLARNDDEVKKIGIEWALKQLEGLKNTAAGIHWYVLNQPDIAESVLADSCQNSTI